jgi:hypothetical protein
VEYKDKDMRILVINSGSTSIKFQLRDVAAETIRQAELVTPELERIIEENSRLAPLHNPANLMGIRAVRAVFPEVRQAAVFDTAFHAAMKHAHPPEQAGKQIGDYTKFGSSPGGDRPIFTRWRRILRTYSGSVIAAITITGEWQ